MTFPTSPKVTSLNRQKHPQKSCSNTFDPEWFARNAGPLFRDWLFAEYRGNVRVISRMFDVREQTVCYWLSQTTTPNGKAMMGALIAFPPFRERVEIEYLKHLAGAA